MLLFSDDTYTTKQTCQLKFSESATVVQCGSKQLQ